MVEAKRSDDWDRMASLMTLVANMVPRAKGSKPLTIEDFHPFIEPTERLPFEHLKALVKNGNGRSDQSR